MDAGPRRARTVTTDRPRHRARRSPAGRLRPPVDGALRPLVALLVLLSAVTIVVAGETAAPTPVAATAGTPDPPSVVFQEGFENGLGAATAPLGSYVGSGGTTYTAAPFWLNYANCNGVLVRYLAPTFSSGHCTNVDAPQSQVNVRRFADVLGQVADGVVGGTTSAAPVNGSTAATQANHAVAAWTTSTNGANNLIEFESSPITHAASGDRYYGLSIDVVEASCTYLGGANNSRLDGYLRIAGVERKMNSASIRACTDARGGYYTSPTLPALPNWGNGGPSARGGRFYTDGALSLTPAQVQGVQIVVRNAVGTSDGNDHAIDNVRLLDVTPQLDKSFSPALTRPGATSRLTMTVTNSSELSAKTDWRFTDSLPAGVTIASTPAVASTCSEASGSTARSIVAVAGGSTIAVTGGDLLSGQASCTISVNVTAAAPGTYVNGASNITNTNLKLPPDATLTVIDPAIHLVKAAGTPSDTDSPANGIDAGDTIPYRFTVTNAGNGTPPDPLRNVSVTDPKCAAAPVYVSGDANGDTILQGTESWIFQCSRVLTQADIDAGSVVNTATATGTASDGTNVTDDDTATAPLTSPSSIDLVKSADHTAFSAPGETITYTFVATNSGATTLRNVTVTDPLPGLSALSCTPATPVTLAPGAKTTCTATYTTTQADADANQVVNTASTKGTPPSGADVTDRDTVTIPGTEGPSIDLVKRASPTTFSQAGDTITYAFDVTNTGNVSLANVAVTDPLAGLTTPSCAPSAPGTLLPGGTMHCTASYAVTQADVDAGEVQNTASVTGRPPSGSPVSDTDSATVTGSSDPAISLVKTPSPTTFSAAGDTISYSFRARNTGNVTLTNVTVTDPLPGLSALACSPALPATLAPGAATTCTATYAVTQADVDAGEVRNTASTTGRPPSGSPVSDTDTATVTGSPDPAIDLVKSASPQRYTAAGEVVIYTFVTTNTGNVTLTGVRTTDPLPGLSALSCTPAAPATLIPGATMTCSADHTVTQADVDAGQIVNTATTTGRPPTGPAVTDEDTETVTGGPTAVPGIDLIKSAEPVRVTKTGDEVTYTFLATNTGGTVLSDVRVVDPLPGLGALDCTPGAPATLLPGASMTCSATYETTQADVDAGSIENTAIVAGTPPSGSPVTDVDEVEVPITPTPAIDLIKTASASAFSATGETITYRFVATNTGNVTLHDASIGDPLPGLSDLDCAPAQPATLAPGQQLTCTATRDTTQADLDAGRIHNTATATGTSPDDVDVTDADAVTVTGAQAGSIDLVKTASPISFTRSGQTIDYRFVATNTGNVTLTGVEVDDPLPGLSPLSCTPGTPATLPPGANVTCTATYRTTQDDVDAGHVHNTATATGTTPVGSEVSDDDTRTVTSSSDPAIDLTKSADPTVFTAAGQTITYRFVTTNTGTVTLSGVRVTDPLPGLSALDCDPTAPAALLPGATMTCTARYTTTQADVDAGRVTNTAAAIGTGPGGADVTDSDDEVVTAAAVPAIDLVKSSTTPSYATPGEPVTYTFVATNTGGVTLSGVRIDDPLPGLSPLSCAPGAPATLAPGAKITCTATYAATQDDLDRGAIVNTATASGTPPTGPVVSDTDDHRVPASPEPSLSLVKSTDDASFAGAGDTVTYRFVATNTGNQTLSDVTVTDPLPGLSTLSCSPATAATLAPGQQVRCTASYTTTQADADAGTIHNAASATGVPPTGPSVQGTDDVDVPGVPLPAIDLVKSADEASFTEVGDPITYRFTATNTGNVTLHAVTIDDPRPGLSALSCTPQAPATLAPGEKLRCSATYEATQADVDTGLVHNTATVTGTPPTGPSVDDTDQHTVPGHGAPSIDLTKTADRTTYRSVGDTIGYRFVATNTGAVTLHDVEIADPHPGLSALSCTPAAPATLRPGQALACTASYRVTQDDLDAGKVHNAAATSGTPPTGPPVGDTDHVDLLAEPDPSLDLVKTADVASFAAAGDPITYRLVATNTGNVTLHGVRVDDPLPGLSALSCAPAAPATLAPGARLTCTATYRTSQADVDAGAVHNGASASGTPPTGPPVGATDDLTTPAGASPALDLVKSADVTSFGAAGDLITYRLVATNTGNVTLSGVRISDPLPGLSPLSCTPSAPATLAPGAELACTATYRTTQDDVDAGRVRNTAAATGTPPTGPSVGAVDDVTVPSDVGPAIDLVKRVDTTTIDLAGQTLRYTFVATNTGNVTLRNVVIEDPLPGLSALACTPEAPAALAPGAHATCTATYRTTQADIDAGRVDNTATVTGTPPSGAKVTDTDTRTVVAPADPGLVLEKSADTSSFAAEGDPVTYTFVATNTGNVTLTGVEIADPLAGLSALSCSPAAPAVLAPGEALTCSAGYAVTSSDVDAGRLTNTAVVTGTTPAGGSVGDDDTVTLPSKARPSISLAKRADRTVYRLGDTVAYTLVATNTGSVDLEHVEITDPLDGLSDLACQPEQPVDIAPHETVTCTANYVVTQADVDRGSLANTATASAGPGDTAMVSATDAAIVQVLHDTDGGPGTTGTPTGSANRPGGFLPRTGRDIGLLTIVGAGLVAVGLLVAGAARRPRRA